MKILFLNLNSLPFFALLIAFGQKPLFGVGSGAYSDQIVGTKAFGMGNTFVATADDASAIFFNPAGLTQLHQIEIMAGAAVLYPQTKYQSSHGQSDEMKSTLPVVPHFYVAVPLKGKLTAGFGIHSPYGLETHWGNKSPLRYVATDSYLQLVCLNPSIAYEWNDTLSMGAGLVYGFTHALLRSRINQTGLNSVLTGMPTVSPDGGKKLDGSGRSWGYDAGILYKFLPNHRVGLSYRSQLSAKLDGTVELSGLSGAAQSVFGNETYETAAETNIKFPETVLFGYAFQPGKWTFEADAEWVHYSRMKETLLSFPEEQNTVRRSILNTGNPIERDWRNTWNAGFGINYQVKDQWQLRGGYFHYPRVIPTATFDPSLPENSRNGYTAGLTYQHRSYNIDLAYNFIDFNNRSVQNDVGAESGTDIDGTYKTKAHILAVSFTARFSTNLTKGKTQ